MTAATNNNKSNSPSQSKKQSRVHLVLCLCGIYSDKQLGYELSTSMMSSVRLSNTKRSKGLFLTEVMDYDVRMSTCTYSESCMQERGEKCRK